MGVIDWPARLEEIGHYYRLGMEGRASRSFAYYIEQLLKEFPKIPSIYASQLEVLLNYTLAAQERQDFLLLADLLEYEVSSILNCALPCDTSA